MSLLWAVLSPCWGCGHRSIPTIGKIKETAGPDATWPQPPCWAAWAVSVTLWLVWSVSHENCTGSWPVLYYHQGWTSGSVGVLPVDQSTWVQQYDAKNITFYCSAVQRFILSWIILSFRTSTVSKKDILRFGTYNFHATWKHANGADSWEWFWFQLRRNQICEGVTHSKHGAIDMDWYCNMWFKHHLWNVGPLLFCGCV